MPSFSAVLFITLIKCLWASTSSNTADNIAGNLFYLNSRFKGGDFVGNQFPAISCPHLTIMLTNIKASKFMYVLFDLYAKLGVKRFYLFSLFLQHVFHLH